MAKKQYSELEIEVLELNEQDLIRTSPEVDADSGGLFDSTGGGDLIDPDNPWA